MLNRIPMIVGISSKRTLTRNIDESTTPEEVVYDALKSPALITVA